MKVSLEVDDWKRLLREVGATPSDWESSITRASLDHSWRVALRTKGIDVNIDEVEVDSETGVFTYQGQQVTIYIKDTRKPRDVLLVKEDAVRFHVTDCSTITTMKQNNRYQRYVAIARTDGAFPVFSREEDNSSLELEVELAPCKNCLRELNYRDYETETAKERAAIWQNFQLVEFFSAYASQISILPRDSCSALPDSMYVSDWHLISRRVRERARWRCDLCGVRLESFKRALHVHHRDRDKSNNRWANLQPLCAVCHAVQVGHETMFVDPMIRSHILDIRAEQAKVPR